MPPRKSSRSPRKQRRNRSRSRSKSRSRSTRRSRSRSKSRRVCVYVPDYLPTFDKQRGGYYHRQSHDDEQQERNWLPWGLGALGLAGAGAYGYRQLNRLPSANSNRSMSPVAPLPPPHFPPHFPPNPPPSPHISPASSRRSSMSSMSVPSLFHRSSISSANSSNSVSTPNSSHHSSRRSSDSTLIPPHFYPAPTSSRVPSELNFDEKDAEREFERMASSPRIVDIDAKLEQLDIEDEQKYFHELPIVSPPSSYRSSQSSHSPSILDIDAELENLEFQQLEEEQKSSPSSPRSFVRQEVDRINQVEQQQRPRQRQNDSWGMRFLQTIMPSAHRQN